MKKHARQKAVAVVGPENWAREFLRLDEQNKGRDTFATFLEMAWLAIRKTTEPSEAERELIEARYMRCVRANEADVVRELPRYLATLLAAMEKEPGDYLGRLLSAIGKTNTWIGQFFTPFEVCRMMAQLSIDEDMAVAAIADKGYVTLAEPACGSGAMLIAAIEQLKRIDGFDLVDCLVEATDIDERAVQMAYLQLVALEAPAVVIHGNALTNEAWSVSLTPRAWAFCERHGEAFAEFYGSALRRTKSKSRAA